MATIVADSQISRRASEASLTFRGIGCAPSEVAALIAVEPSLVGERGGRLQSGALIKRSFVRYDLALPARTRLDEMIPALLAHLGGVETILRAKERAQPEFLEFDLLLPVKDSLEQEGGFITSASIADLHALGATISFGFVSGSLYLVA